MLLIPEVIRETPTPDAPLGDLYEAPNKSLRANSNLKVMPIGGGEGYGGGVTQEEAVLVSTKEELLNALDTFTAGGVIYIDDGTSIDLSGEANLHIPAGVTLASCRGRNIGAK